MSRMVQLLVVTAFALAVSTSQGMAAESSEPQQLPADAKQLVETVLKAKDQFRPISAQDVAQRKQALIEALQELDRELTANAPDLVEPLKVHLKRETLAQELQKESPDLKVLQEIRGLFYADQAGLELPVIRRTREALGHYFDSAYVAADKAFPELFPARIEDLAKRLGQYHANPNSDDRIAIGQILGWLERAGQTPELVQDIRSAFAQPNLYAEVSQKLVSSSMSQDVYEEQSVRDRIMGTSMRGTARMNGHVTVELVPDEERAAMDVLLDGCALSSNVGYNGPVKVFTTGRTNISASKRVFLNPDGLVGEDAVADCSTDSKINSIKANCGLIRRVAWKKARQQQPQAERVASAHAEVQVADRFDGRVAEMLDKANENFKTKFRAPLLRRDAFPNSLHFSTDAQQLIVTATRSGASQTAAAGPPPAIEGTFDLAVRIHDSMVINVGESIMSAETLSDERLVKMLQDAKMEIPPELKIGPDKDAWSITFARDLPLRISFEGQKITVAVTGRQFTRNDQVVREPMRISAVYVPAKTDNGMTLRREGDVNVAYVQNRGKESVAMLAMKTFMRNKFDAMFKAEIDPKRLSIPGSGQENLPVQLANVQAADGWLTLGWTQMEAPASGAPASEAPAQGAQ